MKKATAIASSAILLGLLAAGCGNNNNADAPAASASVSAAPSAAASAAPASAAPAAEAQYKDGTYTAEGEMDAESGWASKVEVTVTGGVVSAVKFTGVDKDGNDKQEYSKAGKYGMKEKNPKAQGEWHEEIAKAEEYYMANQGAAPTFDAEGKTDAISGVSIHVGEYWTLVQKALEGAK
ncbi:FMN-binding protein [Paenibacillus sp. HN-1]|uniref:FMN-binding protein n=1 Tax=Paenibacillus TaxID=44249 RepID=UPI001CA8CEDC|nr:MULTISPECIES: FMN-binding protein [Paenibacillus]MBY9079972.1 FMN-binding protein [Paenibacillus sp. CGMCC 1.18879]MBY9084614.1 FMN-binding protein [Paenibacillus sinensis]